MNRQQRKILAEFVVQMCYNNPMNKITNDRPSLQRHRLQRFWQILFPALVALVLLIVAGGLIVAAESSENRLWTDVALIWLITPVLLLSLLLLAVVIVLIYLLSRLTKGIPPLGGRAQEIAGKVNLVTRKLAEITYKPFMFLRRARDFLGSFFTSHENG